MVNANDSVSRSATARGKEGIRTAARRLTGVRADAVQSPSDVRPIAARCLYELKSARLAFPKKLPSGVRLICDSLDKISSNVTFKCFGRKRKT